MTTIDMTIRELLFWIVLGGSIGGVTAVLIRVRLVNDGLLVDELSARLRNLLYLAAFSSLIGSAAALAFQWILIGVGKFQSSTQIEDIMFILATSVVAGYVARGILPMIASQSEKLIGRLESVDKKVEHVGKKLESVDKKVEDVEEDLRETSLLMRAVGNELESYLRSHPTDRRSAIILATICRAHKDLGGAIAILDRFLKAKADLQQFDKDYADALYNRACYNLLLLESTRDAKHKDQAYEDLKKSIEISPSNKVDAQSDEDFRPLWQEDRFKALGRKHTPSVSAALVE
jgi:tetratricopeptide (TPR) repeat protein